MCITGFRNTDRYAYNGCEDTDSQVTYPFMYGGYKMGDPQVEAYMAFLCLASADPAYKKFITFPIRVCEFNSRNSLLNSPASPPLWY